MHRSVLLAFWFAAACTGGGRSEPVDPAGPRKGGPVEPIEPVDGADGQLIGVMQTLEGLTLQVHSSGCRKHADVTFAVDQGRLSIANLADDRCEAEIVLGANLTFAWSEVPAASELGFTLAAAPVVEPGTTPGPTAAPAGASDEPIYGVLVTPDGLDVRVSASGCTDRAHFVAWVEPGETERVHLVRTQLDRCEAWIPEGAVLHFTWSELGVTKGWARLGNPIARLPRE